MPSPSRRQDDGLFDLDNTMEERILEDDSFVTNPGGTVDDTEGDRCKFLDRSLPWFLAIAALTGLLTAISGLAISMNCDFFAASRVGYCKGGFGGFLLDKNRCCGGVDNFDAASGGCITPAVVQEDFGTVLHQQWISWGEAYDRGIMPVPPWFVYIGGSIVTTGMSAYLLVHYAPSAKGSGIPDVKAATSGFSLLQAFSVMTLICKSIGLSLAVGAGLALGKEGPLIHVGVCWAHIVRKLPSKFGRFANSLPLYELICVGAAAGVSTAFGAPLGGVLFAVEELGSVRTLSPRSLLLAFTGSFTASFVLKSYNMYGLNQLTMFKLSTPTNSPSKEWRPWELILFLVIGVMGGLVGAVFVKLNLQVVRRRSRLARQGKVWYVPSQAQDWLFARLPERFLTRRSNHQFGLAMGGLHVLDVIFVASVTASLNYFITPLLRVNMPEVIYALFEGCPNEKGDSLGLCNKDGQNGFEDDAQLQATMLLSAIIRLLQTAITFGMMVPSGLFIPSLFIGALIGRLVGIHFLTIDSFLAGARKTPLNPGVFAMLGAIGTLSGFARMTVSLVVIMLELTGEINYVVPFMVSVFVAKLVGDYFTPSIYDAHSVLNGYTSIEEADGVRFGAAVCDVAAPCSADDVLDISRPTIMDTLFEVVGIEVETGTESISASMVSRQMSEEFEKPDCLVLVHGEDAHEVRGIVSRQSLRRWLLKKNARPGTFCRFVEPTPLRASCADCFSSARPDEGDREDLDANELVVTDVRCLLSSSPLLTAVCAFREYPELSHCVCRVDDNGPRFQGGASLGVLSRSKLEAALSERRFAAAFYDYENQFRSLPGRSRSKDPRRVWRPFEFKKDPLVSEQKSATSENALSQLRERRFVYGGQEDTESSERVAKLAAELASRSLRRPML